MIALYRNAAARAPDDLALAAALGRVYFELEMLDEATEQFEKLEMRAPDMPVVHAFLGAVFERSGEARAAFDEYRRALRLGHAFDWPHRCHVCSATAPTWQDRCPQCQRWNTLRPSQGR
jgi:lipopolysaccharide biosynthesis regulator YciM